jgi:hypothetical protein
MILPQKDIGQKMKEACENCCKAFSKLADALNKLSNNKKFAPQGSRFHK